MSYEKACISLRDKIWEPTDYTSCFWYRYHAGFYWSEVHEENPNPDKWEDSYSTERVRSWDESSCKKYVLVTMDDDCGGQYQAMFSLDKEISPEGE